jgi:hypothetical protein
VLVTGPVDQRADLIGTAFAMLGVDQSSNERQALS